MMKARIIALLLCGSDALSTTAGPPRSLFLAKPTVPAKALVDFFSANGCSVTDVDVHTRFAFAEFETWCKEEGPLRGCWPWPWPQQRPWQ